MTSNTPQRCPICSTEVESHPRYPRYVCRDCARRVRSADGRPLEFFNRDLSGGFAARYADTGAPYRSHECLIDGVECYADEARLGGIVIQTQRPSGASHDRNVRKPVSATYQSLARAHLANYKRRTLGVSEDGPWLKTGKVYPHISPWRLRKLNILPSIRAEFFAHPRSQKLDLHRDFHHLNSSQALGFNIFFPFFGLPEVDPSILLECLGASPGTIKDWAFEHVADEEEGTNFDFFILFASGHRVYIEVKFAESSFGTCVDDAQHRSKLDSI